MSVAQKSKVATAKVGRNDPCPCGSGKKFKQCCEGKNVPEFVVDAAVAPQWNIKARLQVHRNSAEEHRRHGRWEDAVYQLEEVVRLDPENSDAHFDLGIAEMRRGLLHRAIISFQRALTLKPGREDALSALAWTLENRPASRRTPSRPIRSSAAGRPIPS